MRRTLDLPLFNDIYERRVVEGRFNEEPDYYPRYRSRYRELLEIFCGEVGSDPKRVLDIGGGQLAVLASLLWGDHATAADIGGEHLSYLREQGVEAVEWNLCTQDCPFDSEFDAIFFSEVIEHLPVPGHVVLEKLLRALRPGGLLILSTPNLYRLRNLVYMAIGKQIFDYLRRPEEGPFGHVLEFSPDQLLWQLERAGFSEIRIERRQFHHRPKDPIFRAMSWIGSPLFLIPRFRDHLVATARRQLP
jgi:SAM-dependent methyltransferase